MCACVDPVRSSLFLFLCAGVSFSCSACSVAVSLCTRAPPSPSPSCSTLRARPRPLPSRPWVLLLLKFSHSILPPPSSTTPLFFSAKAHMHAWRGARAARSVCATAHAHADEAWRRKQNTTRCPRPLSLSSSLISRLCTLETVHRRSVGPTCLASSALSFSPSSACPRSLCGSRSRLHPHPRDVPPLFSPSSRSCDFAFSPQSSRLMRLQARVCVCVWTCVCVCVCVCI